MPTGHKEMRTEIEEIIKMGNKDKDIELVFQYLELLGKKLSPDSGRPIGYEIRKK